MARKLYFLAMAALCFAASAFAQEPSAARDVLLGELRAVVAENPSLADGVGGDALAQALQRVAQNHPRYYEEAKTLAAGWQATTPRAFLLQNVREVVAVNPALRDGNGVNALQQGLAQAIGQKPEWRDALVAEARKMRPDVTFTVVRAPEPSALPVQDALSFAGAAPQGNGDDVVLDMELEDLMQMKVTTASKSSQRAFDVPSAITVITSEDIRRSGQTSVMEILRQVPGLQVSRINSSGWAISSRGFADEYANKMLVMMDGRTIYSPTFSGTFWDAVNLPLEEIDRIEVIRGPGAAIWGANAVNGVINIVTKHAQNTQGAYAMAGFGTEDRLFAETRAGGKINDSGHYRVYAKYMDRDALENAQGVKQQNGWDRMLAGFRADVHHDAANQFTLQGELQKGENDQETLFFGALPNAAQTTVGYLRGKWETVLSAQSQLTVQTSLDYHERITGIIDQRVSNFDVDMHHALNLDRNDLIWGLGYRLTSDEYRNTPILNFNMPEAEKQLFSAFVQNTHHLNDYWDVVLGSRLEHNDYTGFEVQPSARMAYKLSTDTTLWGGVSRAVRSPSRIEDGIEYTFAEIAGVPVTRVVGYGSADVESENLIAYELGYRTKVKDGVLFEAAAYYNDYDNLTALSSGTPFFDGGMLIQPLYVNNLGKAQSYGIELSSSWQVTSAWSLAGYYTFSRLNTETGAGNQLLMDYESMWPKHMAHIRSQYTIAEGWEFDTALYYTSSLPDAREVDGSLSPVDAYLKWDVRLGWRPTEGVELSLSGLDLLESGQPQFINSRFYPASAIGRAVYGRAALHF